MFPAKLFFVCNLIGTWAKSLYIGLPGRSQIAKELSTDQIACTSLKCRLLYEFGEFELCLCRTYGLTIAHETIFVFRRLLFRHDCSRLGLSEG
jgi:hypothetical protein